MAQVVESGLAIRLEARESLARRREWREWKPKGYRVLDSDGVRVWHEHEAIRRLVLAAFEDCDADVFLFGSRASGEARERSDYDVGFFADVPPPARKLSALREQLEDLPIPSHVELVDFCTVPDRFSEMVLERRDVQVWKRGKRRSLFTSTSSNRR